MSIFQRSVLKKYLQAQDATKVNAAYEVYKAYFQNREIQQNIRVAKEEQFQEGFLRELFVNVLGYTLNPQPEYNLTTELKNEKGAKKADGAILQEGKAVGVIELKGTDTIDLDKVNEQAFNYKNNQSACVYVVTSNFEKLRFFIHNAVDYVEFNLFTLSREDFGVLWFCLQADNILGGLPAKAKEESLVAEEAITKALYKDYSDFKNALWQNMVKNSPEADQLLLYRKTQKLLDRFLFIFFSEDKGLLPPNSIGEILKQWEKLKELDEYRPLYERFLKYFGYLNAGYRGKHHDIFAYNGGLFYPDELLDNIKIDDDVLHPHVSKLTTYDFESDVDVNILGHIFEHSLNDIDNITAQQEGREVDKSKTRRKKDGVFYTPKYITKYIVDNTLGKLCEKKKQELEISDEIYEGAKKRSRKRIEKLDAYREWLLDLKICDPACGSGAFLNQALEFLLAEHQYLDELTAKYHGASLVLSDIKNTVLENNIYGVDLNEESVEIAKLSLWLRTAEPGRKLSNLSHNIKCGNSLIDDPEVAGEKAFNWQENFPEVFKKGGFDVVIGNPPYVRQEFFTDIKPHLEKKYIVYDGIADLYVYFIEKGVTLLKLEGMFGFIVPNKWLKITYAHSLRKWLKTKKVIELVDFGDLPVFADATAYPCILTIKNSEPAESFMVSQPDNLNFGNLNLYVKEHSFDVNFNSLEEAGWNLVSNTQVMLLEKLMSKGISLHQYTGGIIRRGVVTGYNEAFVIDENIKNELIAKHKSSSDIIKPFLAGKDVKRYSIDFQNRYLIFTRRGINIDEYPAIREYLEQFRNKLEPKPLDWKGNWEGRKPGSYKWYEIQDSVDYYAEFEKPKIIYPNICAGPEFSYDESNFYSNQKCFILPKGDKYLLGILNSSIFLFLFKMILPKLRGGYFEPGYIYLKKFPIIPPTNEQSQIGVISNRVDSELELHLSVQQVTATFLTHLQSKFEIEKVSKNLGNWPDMDFKGFLKELKKQKVKLSLTEEAEWLTYFNEQKAKANALQADINRIDKEIDQMVYELYGLTEEEIKIVEGS